MRRPVFTWAKGRSTAVATLLLALILALLPARLAAHPGSGILVDKKGNVYFMDTGSGLWKVDPAGKLVRITAPRFHWMALDEGHRFSESRLPSNTGGAVERAEGAQALLVASDHPMVIGLGGDLFHPSRYNGTWVDLVRFAPSGRSTTVGRVQLPWLNGLAAAPDGSLYYTGNHGVWRMTLQGRVTTIATNVALGQCATIPGASDEPGPFLRGLAVDASGNAFVAASGCGRVIRIAPSGAITTVIQTEAPWSPTAVALHGTDLYVLEYLHTAGEDREAWVPRVRKVSADGSSRIIATVAR